MKNFEYFIIFFLFALSTIPFILIRKKIKTHDFSSKLCPKCKKSKVSDPRISFLGFVEVHCGKCKKHHKMPLSNSIRIVYLIWLSLFFFSLFNQFNIITILLIILILNAFITDFLAILKSRTRVKKTP